MNFYQDIFFRTLDILRGRRTIKRLKFLRKSQYWSRQQIEDWQLKRVNQLLAHARANSPFYRERLKDITLPLTSLKQMEQLPLLTKADIQQHREEIRCNNVPEKRFVAARTGGSTGEPTHYYWDKRGMDWNRASVYRSGEWAGTQLGERSIQMSGSHYDHTEMMKWRWKLVYLLQRYKDCPVASMTDELLEQYYHELMQFRPTNIWGYAGGIYHFARYIREHHPEARFPFIKALLTSSETLGKHQREFINSVFGANKVFDNYGSREMYMAAECNQHNGYHIHAEVLFAEVVDKDNRQCPPGELGRVVMTDLSNFAFPFIRYENGDVARMSDEQSCACGINLPKLAAVEGRIADTLILPDRVITVPYLTVLFSDLKGLKAYQFYQKTKDEVIVRIVPDGEYTDEVRKYLYDALVDMAGDKATITVEEVAEIPVPESGKRRFVISEVAKEEL